jgi:hypothetical protein
MENTTHETNPTATEKLARVPGEVGTTIVEGTETILDKGARIIVHAGTVVIEATKVAAKDVVEATERLGHDAKQAVSPTHETPKASTASSATTRSA